MRILILSKLAVVFLIFFQFPAAISAEEATLDKKAESSSAKKNSVKNNTQESSHEAKESFYSGLNYFNQSNFAKSSKSFEKLKKESELKGYINIPKLSISLLAQARLEKEKGNDSGVEFLVDWANKLSPTDSKVALLSSSLSGYFSGIIKAVKNLNSATSLFSVILVNGILISLFALTISLFVTLIIQLGKNSEILIDYSFSILPHNYRGFLGPVVTAFILVLPLYFGLAVSLACWSIILGFCIKSCKALPLLTSGLFLGWLFLLPFLKDYTVLSSDPVLLAIDSVNSGSYNMKDKEVLEKATLADASSDLYKYFYAQTLVREGDYKKAEVYFKSVLSNVKPKSSLYRNALVNSATLSILQKKYKDSASKLEEAKSLGESSFELYYNLAQTNIGLLDTVSYEANYQLAKAKNAEKLTWSESKLLAENAPLFKSMGLPALSKTILKSQSFKKLVDAKNNTSSNEGAIYSSLFPSKSPKGHIQILTILLSLLGLYSVSRKFKYHLKVDKAFFGSKTSRIWLGFPSGGLIAGKRPVLGSILLAGIIASLMAYIDKPVSMLEVSSVPLGFQGFFLVLTIFLFILGILFALILGNKNEKTQKVRNA